MRKILVCPKCKGLLVQINNSLKCKNCNLTFTINSKGYFNFLINPRFNKIQSFTLAAAELQVNSGNRMYEEYIKPVLFQEPSKRILDVGCGVGTIITRLINDGYDAYGIDLPYVSQFWSKHKNDSKRFFISDASYTPFPDDYFDLIISLGVIEHIGTITGHCILAKNYMKIRQQYANELLRIIKPIGRIIISSPNKTFPIDIQHGLGDIFTPNTLINKLRAYIMKLTGMNIHPFWGKYHLLSYSDVKKLFCDKDGAQCYKPLPLRNYFNFNRIDIDYNRFLKPFIKLLQFYVNNIDQIFPFNFLKPYTIVQIRKS